VFGVTRDLFVVFTSNAFAVLGLRALYFLLAGSADRFVYLKPGIALLLVFIGVKMLLYDVVHMPLWVSLAVITAVAGGAIGASVWRDRRMRRLRAREPYAADEESRCAGDGARMEAGQLVRRPARKASEGGSCAVKNEPSWQPGPTATTAPAGSARARARTPR
jgi:tellurite resistance protein TerC